MVRMVIRNTELAVMARGQPEGQGSGSSAFSGPIARSRDPTVRGCFMVPWEMFWGARGVRGGLPMSGIGQPSEELASCGQKTQTWCGTRGAVMG